MLGKTLEGLLDCKEAKPVNPKGNQSWIFIGRTDAEAETPILRPPVWSTDSFEKLWCWETLKTGEGNDRRWDGWMASLTRWTWDWTNSTSWWWTAKPGMLQFMGSQRVGHDWATELNRTSSKKQVSFNFMAAVIICSDFGAQENKVCFHWFPVYWLWWDWMSWL